MSRRKATNYFSHDSNARNDEKLVRLRMKHSAAGYGVYFMLLERLREEADYMSVKDYNMLAFDLRVDAALIKSVIEDFGLFAFTEDGKCFYSESFKRRMNEKDEKQKLLSEAGKRGGEKRWGVSFLSGGDTQTSGGDCLPIQKLSQQSKEKKEKKEGEIIAPAHDNVNELYLEKFFKTNNERIEALLISLGLSPGDRARLEEVAKEVINEWDISEAFHTSYQDWSSHLISTCRIKLKKENASSGEKDKKDAALKRAARLRDEENRERSRQRDEWVKNSVSHADAKNDPEYLRALQES
jgi:hypothetical protein